MVAPLTCVICKREIPGGEPVYRQVSGWEKLRSQGGTNALRLRAPMLLNGGHVHACFACIEVRQAGRENQESLL